MDWEVAFNVLWTATAILGGWAIKSITDSIKDLKVELNTLVMSLPNTYARRDDVKDVMARVESTLVRIETKLDNKADKE